MLARWSPSRSTQLGSPRSGRGGRPAPRRRTGNLARSSKVTFQCGVPRAAVVVLDDAAEVSGYALGARRDAVAVRARDGSRHVLPWVLALDSHARSPALGAVHFTPPGRAHRARVPVRGGV